MEDLYARGPDFRGSTGRSLEERYGICRVLRRFRHGIILGSKFRESCFRREEEKAMDCHDLMASVRSSSKPHSLVSYFASPDIENVQESAHPRSRNFHS